MPTPSVEPAQLRITPPFCTDAFKRHVADQPLRSALLAVAAGALAMLLIRAQLTKRAETRKWERMTMR